MFDSLRPPHAPHEPHKPHIPYTPLDSLRPPHAPHEPLSLSQIPADSHTNPCAARAQRIATQTQAPCKHHIAMRPPPCASSQASSSPPLSWNRHANHIAYQPQHPDLARPAKMPIVHPDAN